MLASSLTIRSATFSPRSEFRSIDVMRSRSDSEEGEDGPTETIPMYQVSSVTSVPATSSQHRVLLRAEPVAAGTSRCTLNTVSPIGRISR